MWPEDEVKREECEAGEKSNEDASLLRIVLDENHPTCRETTVESHFQLKMRPGHVLAAFRASGFDFASSLLPVSVSLRHISTGSHQ